MAQGSSTAATAGEEVVPAPEYRALEAQVGELHGLLCKKAMENALLRDALSRYAGQKELLLRSTSVGEMDGESGCRGGRNCSPAMRHRPAARPRGRPPLPDAKLVAEIRALVADLPTPAFAGAGSMAIAAFMLCCARKPRRPGAKRSIRTRLPRHEGAVATAERRTPRRTASRWSGRRRSAQHPLVLRRVGDHLWDNGEKVRVAFALNRRDREAMGHAATTGGITAEPVQDLMVATVEHRYGQVNRVPEPIEWLTDNGRYYTARNTRAFARGIGLIPRTTPVSSAQSNGMAEAFARTLKREYVRVNPRAECADRSRPFARLVRPI